MLSAAKAIRYELTMARVSQKPPLYAPNTKGSTKGVMLSHKEGSKMNPLLAAIPFLLEHYCHGGNDQLFLDDEKLVYCPARDERRYQEPTTHLHGNLLVSL